MLDEGVQARRLALQEEQHLRPEQPHAVDAEHPPTLHLGQGATRGPQAQVNPVARAQRSLGPLRTDARRRTLDRLLELSCDLGSRANVHDALRRVEEHGVAALHGLEQALDADEGRDPHGAREERRVASEGTR